MKLFNRYTILGVCALAAAFVTSSCDDDDVTKQLRSEAKIEQFSFSVTGTGLQNPDKADIPTFRTSFSEDGHTIYIRVPENIDPAIELKGATVQFFISAGATVEPSMTEPQDFSDLDNPVVYTVTSADGSRVEKYYVTYTIIEPICVPDGQGFTAGELGAVKTYVELGFPGQYASWSYSPSDIINVTMGDLMGSPAFCGKDHVVVFSARYAWGDDGSTKAENAMPANPQHALKVFDIETLSDAGQLNLGGIQPSEIVAVASDWKGNMVAAVGRKASGKTDFYYWTAPDAAPVHVGTAPVSVEIGNHNADAGSYINVAGDITGAAVIAAAAPRDDKGSHYRFKIAGGRLLDDYKIIQTGHSANDKSWFQMVSFFGADDNAPYLVGDGEINPGEDNGQIRVYLNNANGTNRGTMDYHLNGVINGWTHDDGEEWWSRNGKWLARGGGRRPTVHAMVINGKPYSYFTTGSDWRGRGILLEQDLNTGVVINDAAGRPITVNPYPHFGFGKITAAKHPTGDGGMWIGQSFGMMADWYFNDETHEGYVAVWADRFGLIMFKLTCLEL